MRLSGLCGWIAGIDRGDNSTSLLSNMAKGLSVNSGELKQAAGNNFSLVLQGPPDAAQWYEDEILVVAATGNPHLAEPVSRRDTAEQQFAASFAQLYNKQGADALAQVRGPFSLVVIDKTSGRSLCAIDRFGVESLAYAQPQEDLIVFGSTTDSVKAHPSVGATVAPQTIYNYVYYVDRICAPATIYEEQRKLLPGEAIIRDDRGARTQRYWQMSYGSDRSKSEEQYCSELLEQLRAALARCITNEDLTRTGAFLSGGLDSSSVLSLLAEKAPGPARAFTIGFEEEAYDETPYAEIAARHVGAIHEIRKLSSEHVFEVVPRLTRAYDEPFANSSVVPTYYCALAAKEAGIELMLAGDGGDELFVGNSRYLSDEVFQRYQVIPGGLRNMVVEPLVEHLPFARTIPLFRKAQNYLRSAKQSIAARLTAANAFRSLSAPELFSSDALGQIDCSFPRRFAEDIFSEALAEADVQRMMYLDLRVTLADSDLRKVGRACDMAGVRVRYPFLDEALLDFSATIPPDMFTRNGEIRYLYKKALSGVLHRETINKPKHGFGLPTFEYINRDESLRSFFCDHLVALKKRPFFSSSAIDILTGCVRAGRAEAHSGLAWDLALLEIWLDSRGL